MLNFDLFGGFGLQFNLYFENDCHTKGGKKIGDPGYCNVECKCGKIFAFNSVLKQTHIVF